MQTQAPQQPKPAPTKPHGEYLYYLGVDDEHERRIIEAWLYAKFPPIGDSEFPNTSARYVTSINLNRLTEQHSLCVLMRKPGRGKSVSHAVKLVKNENGIREITHRDAEEMLSEVVECKTLACKDFWSNNGGMGDEGEMRIEGQGGFLEELGKTCAPACIKWRSDPRDGKAKDVLRLAWA